LELVATAKQDSEFVSPQMHTGLWVDLSQVEATANAVLAAQTTNPAVLDDALGRFGQALTQTLARAEDIASRGSERSENKEKAASLVQKLRDITTR
jgi:hypothetical protein